MVVTGQVDSSKLKLKLVGFLGTEITHVTTAFNTSDDSRGIKIIIIGNGKSKITKTTTFLVDKADKLDTSKLITFHQGLFAGGIDGNCLKNLTSGALHLDYNHSVNCVFATSSNNEGVINGNHASVEWAQV